MSISGLDIIEIEEIETRNDGYQFKRGNFDFVSRRDPNYSNWRVVIWYPSDDFPCEREFDTHEEAYDFFHSHFA